jgi:hypothetical protein
MKCLICGKVLEVDSEDARGEWLNLFNGGDSWEIICNYGSRFDCDKFYFGLCDDCIQVKIDAGLLIRNGSASCL